MKKRKHLLCLMQEHFSSKIPGTVINLCKLCNKKWAWAYKDGKKSTILTWR